MKMVKEGKVRVWATIQQPTLDTIDALKPLLKASRGEIIDIAINHFAIALIQLHEQEKEEEENANN